MRHSLQDDIADEIVTCPLLEADMKRFKQAFGDLALTYRFSFDLVCGYAAASCSCF